MAALFAPPHPSLFSPNPNSVHRRLFPLRSQPLPLRRQNPSRRKSPTTKASNGDKPRRIVHEWGEISDPDPEPEPEPEPEPDLPSSSASVDPPQDDDEWGKEPAGSPVQITDEWGEKSEPEAEPISNPDPPRDEDEWGKEESGESDYGNGAPAADYKLGDLKRCLVDTLYGTELGLRTTAEVRGEILELVSQLEAENPTPAPTEAPDLLDGNWILLYTAFSELLPLLAVGATPLLKVKKISQAIDSKTFTIVNATTVSSPFATLSFSATASFEVRSPSRIQVQFKEGTFQPPEIPSTVNLPDKISIFGQTIDLLPVRQALNPLQEAFAGIARGISGQPPLKVPIPGNRSWLVTTYLDEDFRISRGDGGLFVLAKEGSPLLDQLS